MSSDKLNAASEQINLEGKSEHHKISEDSITAGAEHPEQNEETETTTVPNGTVEINQKSSSQHGDEFTLEGSEESIKGSLHMENAAEVELEVPEEDKELPPTESKSETEKDQHKTTEDQHEPIEEDQHKSAEETLVDSKQKSSEQEEKEDLDEFEKLLKGEESEEMLDFVEEEEEEKKEEVQQLVQAEVTVKKKKKKKTKVKRKSLISEDYSSLHTYDSTGITIVGDFVPAKPGIKPTLPSVASTLTDEEEDEVEEESEEEESVEEEEIELSEFERLELYAKYDKLDREYAEVKAKNNYLLTKLVAYYKLKKMYHVLHEEQLPHAERRYEKQLDEFKLITEANNQFLKRKHEEIADLRVKCHTQAQEVQTSFESLQKIENEAANDTISSKAERSIEEKYIERFLKRQKMQLNTVIKIRLDYIKMRNKVNETQEALDALDNFGPNLHLIDYEQLKVDNRNLNDKLEEKEFEINIVRNKCHHTMQILAHKREKSHGLDGDIGHLKKRLGRATKEFENVRGELNRLKREKDHYRSCITTLKEESGLLSRPKLLTDMSNTIRQSDILEEKLERIRNEYYGVVKKLHIIRTNLISPEKLKKIRSVMRHKNEAETIEGIVVSEDVLISERDSELTKAERYY